MKKCLGIILCVFLVFIIFAGCKNNLNQGSINDNDLNSWIGKYEFEEVSDIHSDIRPNPSWVYSISIYKEKSDYYANIDVDGFQTIVRLQAKVSGDENSVKLIFDKYLPDNLFEPYDKGDVLISFEKRNSALYTTWGKILPMLESNNTPDKIYFKAEKK